MANKELTLFNNLTTLLAVRVSWLLAQVLIALWNCYCSPRTFSDFALVFFVNSHVSFCLQLCWTEDASLARNRFHAKANCDQIRLRPRDMFLNEST